MRTCMHARMHVCVSVCMCVGNSKKNSIMLATKGLKKTNLLSNRLISLSCQSYVVFAALYWWISMKQKSSLISAFSNYETKTNWLWNMKWFNYVATLKIESSKYISIAAWQRLKQPHTRAHPHYRCGELKLEGLKVCGSCSLGLAGMADNMENEVWCIWVWNGSAQGRGSRLMSCHPPCLL